MGLLLKTSSSPGSHVGAVVPTKTPQSLTTRLSFVDSLYVLSLSIDGAALEAEGAGQRAGVLDVHGADSGRVAGAHVGGARPDGLALLGLRIVSVPVANVVSALAEVAVKSAPEAAVMPTATSTVASAARVRRGRETRLDRRDMAGRRSWGMGCGRPRGVRASRVTMLLDEVAAGNRAISRCETPGFASPPRDGFALVSTPSIGN